MKTIHVVFVMVWSCFAVFANEKDTFRSKIADFEFPKVDSLCVKSSADGNKINCLIDNNLELRKNFPTQSNASVVYKKTRFQKLQKADFEQWFSSKGSLSQNQTINQQYMTFYKNCFVDFPHHANLLFWYDNYLYRPPTDCEKIYNFQCLRKYIYIVPPIVQGIVRDILFESKDERCFY